MCVCVYIYIYMQVHLNSRVVCYVLVIFYTHEQFASAKMTILSTAENVWVILPRLSQTLQRLHNPSSTSASPARLWSSASRPRSPPQSSCPSIATTPMTKTLPALHPHCRAKPPIPPSHPASAVSLENHRYSLMFVIGVLLMMFCIYLLLSDDEAAVSKDMATETTSSEEEQEFPVPSSFGAPRLSADSPMDGRAMRRSSRGSFTRASLEDLLSIDPEAYQSSVWLGTEDGWWVTAWQNKCDVENRTGHQFTVGICHVNLCRIQCRQNRRL